MWRHLISSNFRVKSLTSLTVLTQADMSFSKVQFNCRAVVLDYSRVVEVFLFCVHPLYLHATCIVHMKSRKHHHTNVCSLCINHCPESPSGRILSSFSFHSPPLSIFGSFLFPLLHYSLGFFACYCGCRIR